MERLKTDLESVRAGYTAVFGHKISNPDDPNDQKYFPSFGRAGDELTNNDPQFLEGLRELDQELPYERRGYKVNRMLRVIQYSADLENDQRYPYDTDEEYAEALRNVIVNPDRWFDIRHRRVASNVDDRYSNVLLLANALPERFGNTVDLLDEGTSRLHGPRRVAYKDKYQFDGIKVLVHAYNKPPRLDRDSDIDEITDQDKTKLLHEDLLHGPVGLGYALGTDIVSLRMDGQGRWSKAGSRYPAEYFDPAWEPRFTDLENPVDGVDFAQVDCLDEGRMREVLDGRKFPMILFSTILYQLRAKRQWHQAIEIAKQHLTDDGVIVALDALNVRKNDPHSFVFPQEGFSPRFPFGYKTAVYDKTRPEAGFEEWFRWQHGRCRIMIPNLGVAAVRKAFSSAL